MVGKVIQRGVRSRRVVNDVFSSLGRHTDHLNHFFVVGIKPNGNNRSVGNLLNDSLRLRRQFRHAAGNKLLRVHLIGVSSIEKRDTVQIANHVRILFNELVTLILTEGGPPITLLLGTRIFDPIKLATIAHDGLWCSSPRGAFAVLTSPPPAPAEAVSCSAAW